MHGIGEAEKTGWLYLLNRETGEPLFPIPRSRCRRTRSRRRAPTQPIPSYAPFVPHELTDAAVPGGRQAGADDLQEEASKVIRAREMYTPYWTTLTAFTPGPQGGTNWQPSSYSPDTNMIYVCAQSGVTANTVTPAICRQAGEGLAAAGRARRHAHARGGFGQNTGYFTRDRRRRPGRSPGRRRWPESCYAGSTATAGNLVFVGRSDGRLQAYDADKGEEKWSFQLGAGANDAPTIFERNGKEYLAFYAGGNALAASPHGDSLWLLGLDGTLDQAAAPGSGQGVGHAGETDDNGNNNSAAGAAAGKKIFADNCAGCHGADRARRQRRARTLTTIPAAKNMTARGRAGHERRRRDAGRSRAR